MATLPLASQARPAPVSSLSCHSVRQKLLVMGWEPSCLSCRIWQNLTWCGLTSSLVASKSPRPVLPWGGKATSQGRSWKGSRGGAELRNRLWESWPWTLVLGQPSSTGPLGCAPDTEPRTRLPQIPLPALSLPAWAILNCPENLAVLARTL